MGPAGGNTITDTRDSLLLRLRDATDRDAWCEFVDVYRPLIYRIGRKQGLQDADAQDVTQRVLATIANRISEWELQQAPGSFRRWLRRVACTQVVDWFRMQRRDAAVGGSGMMKVLQSQTDRQDVQHEQVEAEHRRAVFRWAARRIRNEFQNTTWQAFWLTTVEQQTVDDAATILGQSPGAIYTARSRVMSRLKEVVHSYDSE